MPTDQEIARRNLLNTRANPRPDRDYRITLRKTRADRTGGVWAEITIDYVPDRLICNPAKIAAYYNLLTQQPWSGIEEVANAIIDDFSNELIPRWISVTVAGETDGIVLKAQIEDKQPLWNNPALLGRPK